MDDWFPWKVKRTHVNRGGGRTDTSMSDKDETSPLDDVRPVFFVGEDILVKPGIPENEHYLEEMRKLTVGICAMSKKSKSKPMNEILTRLQKYMQLNTLIFDEKVILHSPVEEWPVVDVLISFFSAGFPLDKAIAYKNLRKPFVVNDLESQHILLDRREVYKTLMKHGIPHPRYSVLNRDEGMPTTPYKFTDNEDAIEIQDQLFHKPFVEKPVSAEDHNVYIYFPAAAGGGSQRLFRKIGSRSSVYSTCSYLRKSGSYIYEDFMPTDGTDVKVYTVGPDYCHAEARKSPALDGKVERDKSGKEIRYPVLLSAKDKLLARKVCLAFKQNVCGFDLLRANGQSYVCDVNGFSFVKNSTKYYDDCAKILGTMIMRAKAPQLHIPWVLGSAPEDIPVVPTTSGSMMELRCVVAVIRHGDRTPKQKMKMEVKHKRFFDLFKKYDGYRTGHLKLKKPKQLQEILDISRFLLDEIQANSDPEIAEKKVKLQQLKLVLEMYGHFSGINRKVQLKYQPYGHPKKSSSEEVFELQFDGDSSDMGLISRSKSKGNIFTYDMPREPSLLLIAKWGGELTPAGKIQAEDLGKAFRTLYPGGQGQFETPGLGFLRLHSTFRHDLKIYASDEGRVQMTAAAFTKGMLAFEGELTPILVQMVKSANTNGLLDKEGESKHQHIVKERLRQLLNEDKEFDEDDIEKIAPTRCLSLMSAIDIIKNPFRYCQYVYSMVQELTAKVRNLKLEHRTRDLKLYNGESWELLIRRWAKLEKDFRMKDGRFEISKIPDIYDCIKYDLQHNQKTLGYERATELFNCSKALADLVIPQEYGITVEEKLHISQNLCTPLMRKIKSDIEQCVIPDPDDESTRLNSKYSKGVSSPERFVRTRLYFTSESHIHSLLNMLRYGGLCNENTDEQWKKAMSYISATAELNYMTQIVIMMFEDPTKDVSSDERFHIELHFSPGAYTCSDKSSAYPLGSGCRTISNNSSSGQAKKPGDLPLSVDDQRQDVLKIKHFDRPVSAPMVIQETEEPEEAEQTKVPQAASLEPLLGLKKHHSHSFSAPMVIQEELEEPDVLESTVSDQDVPEWDWGDGTDSKTETVDKKTPDSPDSAGPVWDWGDDNKYDTIQEQKQRPRETLETDSLFMLNQKQSRSEDLSIVTQDTTEKSEILVSNQKDKKPVDIEPHSPNHDIPEWDWGDGSDSKKENTSIEKANPSISEPMVADSIPVLSPKKSRSNSAPTIVQEGNLEFEESEMFDSNHKVNKPVDIEPHSPDHDIPEWDWGDGSDSKKETVPIFKGVETSDKADASKIVSEPIAIQPIPNAVIESIKSMSLEEKRSRSLEDKQTEAKDPRTDYYVERQYLTVHLPLATDRHRHSFSSLFYLNPEAFKAFEGFNMVPSIRALETMHNNLTMMKLLDFLRRATTKQFMNLTPIESPGGSLSLKFVGCSLPSSSNSSAGPSSPTSNSTPVDFISKLKCYIDKQQKDTIERNDSSSSESSSSKKDDTYRQGKESPRGESCIQRQEIEINRVRNESNNSGSSLKSPESYKGGSLDQSTSDDSWVDDIDDN